METTKIKICGIKRLQDIDYLNELLPDYAGFVFAESKRRVEPERAAELIGKLDPRVKRVGVFVNETPGTVKKIAEAAGLEVLQFHGTENEEYIKQFGGYKVWKSAGISADTEGSLEENIRFYKKSLGSISDYSIDGILADSKVKDMAGGSGVKFNWDIIRNIDVSKPLILAGGLSCSNIEEAVLKVRPYAVDVSSGVETEGIKDYEKIKQFIDKVRVIV